MIEGIKEIGSLVKNSGQSVVQSLIQDIKIKNDQKSHYVINFNFDTINKKVFIKEEVFAESVQQDNSIANKTSIRGSAEKYLYIGNPPGNLQRDRVSLTKDNFKYLFTSTFPTLENNLDDGELKDKIKSLLDTCFDNNEGIYLFKVKECGFCTNLPAKLTDFSGLSSKESRNKVKTFLDAIVKCVYEKIKEDKGISKKDIAFFTASINEKPVAQYNEYAKYLEQSVVEELFSKAENGNCYVCGKHNIPVTSNTTKLKFKYYITDKISFAPYFAKKNFIKNFAICKDCYKKLLAGETFVKNNLRSRFGGATMYIIPKFIFPATFKLSNLNSWASKIKMFVGSADSFEDYQKFKEQISSYKDFEDENNNLLLNLLLCKDDGRSLKIYTLIKDVPPSRIGEIITKQHKIEDTAHTLLSDTKGWDLGFKPIYYLFPVKKNSFDKSLLRLYGSIIEGEKIPRSFLISKFVELYKVFAYEQFSQYNVSGKSDDVIFAALKHNIFLRYLEELNLLEKGGSMNVNSLKLNDDTKNFIREMGYDEQKTALFLLGYLVGIVGNAQYSAGMEKKPILNKITYQGMSIKKIKEYFLNEVFEKLVQYKKIQYADPVFANAKPLLDKNIDRWELSDKENVFYILSGYAFSTFKTMNASKNNKEEKNG